MPEDGQTSASKDLISDLDRSVSMPCDSMLSLMALSELDKADRQYTPAGGWLKAMMAPALAALLMPAIFFAAILPASAISKVLQHWTTLAPSLIDGTMMALVIGAGALAFGRGMVQEIRALFQSARAARRGLEARWGLPFQVLSRIAPHVRGREVTFSTDRGGARGDVFRWAIRAPLGGWNVVVRGEQGPERFTLQTSSTRAGLATRHTRRDWILGEEGWSSAQHPERAPQQSLEQDTIKAVGRTLAPLLVSEPSAHHRLSVWNELAPLTLEHDLHPPEVDPPEDGELAPLIQRPEAATAQPRTAPTARLLWAGGFNYWLCAAAVTTIWSSLSLAALPMLWSQASLANALLTVPLPLLGWMITTWGLVRHRPALPRRRAHKVLHTRSAEALVIDGDVLHTGDLMRGIDLTRPFSVDLTREERRGAAWALLGVTVRQRREDVPEGTRVQFSVPVSRSEAFEVLDELSIDAPLVRPEDFRDLVWPLLRFQAELAASERRETLPAVVVKVQTGRSTL